MKNTALLKFDDPTSDIQLQGASRERNAIPMAGQIALRNISLAFYLARIQESDMHLRLDPDTYAVLPWSSVERRRARIFCDIYMPDGKPFEGDPRGVLKRLLAMIAERGWTYNIGPEPEFFLFKAGGNGSGVRT